MEIVEPIESMPTLWMTSHGTSFRISKGHEPSNHLCPSSEDHGSQLHLVQTGLEGEEEEEEHATII